jgi:hypothetical protein
MTRFALPDDDTRAQTREGCPMNSPAPTFAYISSDVPEQLTLREYGRDLAARHSTGESRLQRALRGLRLGQGSLRVPHARFA